MNRRTFLLGTTLTTGSLFFKSALANFSRKYDLITVKGSDPGKMLEQGVYALGGLERFSISRKKILLKPDIGWNRAPGQGATTNPDLVNRLIRMCYQAGARSVSVVDHTHDEWTKCYKNSGIERAAKDAGAKIYPGNEKSLYLPATIPQAKKLKQVLVHRQLLESDLLMNVPVLKKDPQTNISGCIRNLTGLIWDWEKMTQLGIDHCIVDFLYFKKPVLNIVDAFRVITGNPSGASSDDPSLLQTLILSPDIVAADTSAAILLGINPLDIKHLVLASKNGFGSMSPSPEKTKYLLSSD